MGPDPVCPQDWEAILRRGFESKELDYKGPCVWDKGNKKGCCEIVKDILAMANTKGGFIYAGRLEEDESVRLHMRLHGVQGRKLAWVRGSSYRPMPYHATLIKSSTTSNTRSPIGAPASSRTRSTSCAM